MKLFWFDWKTRNVSNMFPKKLFVEKTNIADTSQNIKLIRVALEQKNGSYKQYCFATTNLESFENRTSETDDMSVNCIHINKNIIVKMSSYMSNHRASSDVSDNMSFKEHRYKIFHEEFEKCQTLH